jgi:hypothetical protein
VAIHTLHQDCSVIRPAPPALLLGYGLIAEPAIAAAVEELARAAAPTAGSDVSDGSSSR